MSVDHGSTRRARTVGVGALSAATLTLALGVVPMAANNAAQAATPAPAGRCDAVVKKPTKAPRGRVYYTFEFTCPLGYTVEVEQRMYKADRGPDQSTAGPYPYFHVFEDDTEWEQATRVKAPNTEPGAEEVYHVVRYRWYDKSSNVSRYYSKTSPVATIK